MLIVEGTDLVGKTALCAELLLRLNKAGGKYQYAHLEKPTAAWDPYWDYAEWIRRHVVQDRFYLSDIAYRWACGENQRVDWETARLIDARLRLVGALTVIVVATPEFLRAQWEKKTRPEMYGLDLVLRANEAFLNLANLNRAQAMLGPGAGNLDYDALLMVDGQAYPSDMVPAIEQIVQAYAERQEVVDAALARRPRTLL